MTTFRWLHLTDLHWGAKANKNLWGMIQKEWFEDIDRLQKKCGGTWDAVFFTGDLINKGTKEEFDELTKLLSDLFNHLKTNGSDPYLIVVPGNHDLKRPGPKSLALKGLMSSWNKDEGMQSDIWDKHTDSETWAIIKDAFENFTGWYKEVATQIRVPDNMKPGLLPGEFTVTLEKGANKIGVLGLNTAFLQLAEGDFKGKLDANAAQIVTACGVHHPQWIEKHDACLLLTHHPVDWLSTHGQEAFYSDIAPSGRFVLHLCGHQHKAGMKVEILGGVAEGRRFWCGNAIFGMEPYIDSEGNPTVARRHGYSAGSLDFSGQSPILRIWPRRLDKKEDGVWRFNQDTFFTLEENESIIPISFFSSRPSPSFVVGVTRTLPDLPPSKLRTEPLGTEIKKIVTQNICRMLAKNRLKCFRAVLQRLFVVKKEGGDETEHIVEALFKIDLIDAIIQLQMAVRECMEDLRDEGKEKSDIIYIWEDCVTLLGWLVLIGVKEEWACKVALDLAEKGSPLDVMIPVETEVGLDIVVSRLNKVKATFNLDAKSLKIFSPARIAAEKWQIESGWSHKEKVLMVKKQLWKQLNPLSSANSLPVSDEQLTDDLKQMLHSRRMLGGNHYMVINPPDKTYPNLEAQVCRELMADLQELNIFYLGVADEKGMAIVAETKLQTQIREFLLTNPNLRTDK